jgi:hypothetical protein
VHDVKVELLKVKGPARELSSQKRLSKKPLERGVVRDQ